MDPAVQPDGDEYVMVTGKLASIDRELIDNRALRAIFDRIVRDEPVPATAFANYVS